MDRFEKAFNVAKDVYGVRTFRQGETIPPISTPRETMHMDVIWIAYIYSGTAEIVVSVMHTDKSKLGTVTLMNPNDSIFRVKDTKHPVILENWTDSVYDGLSKMSLLSNKQWAPTYDGDAFSVFLYLIGGCTTTRITILSNPQDESINKLCMSILDSAIHIASVTNLKRLKSKINEIPKPILVSTG